MRFSFSVFAALAAATAIGAAAIGAHGQGRLDGQAATWVETAADYQLIHAVALLVCEALGVGRAPKWLFAIGIVCFLRFALYNAATGARWAACGTPVGGTAFIAAWLALGLELGKETAT